MVHQPGVLFLDEPSQGLDLQNRASLWDHIRELRERGTTVFLTTHYLDEADVLCDHIMIVDHETVVDEGSPRAIKRSGGSTGRACRSAHCACPSRAWTACSSARPAGRCVTPVIWPPRSFPPAGSRS